MNERVHGCGRVVLLGCVAAVLLGGCGGGGSGASSYTVGGTVSGLSASGLTLTDNGGDTLSVSSGSTSFVFSNPVSRGSAYDIAVASQPTGQNCMVSSGSGVVSGNVTTASVTCSTTYTIGGTLTGLASGAQVTLLDNGSDPLTLTANGPFTFSTAVPSGQSYAVTVGTQPTPQSCTVSDGSGTVTGATTAVGVACEFNERVLHTFAGGSDGATPNAGLIMDSSGNLYGTTTAGGSGGYGTVFKLAPNGSGGYGESILYTFSTGSSAQKVSGLIMDSHGDLYGTTSTGGSAGDGAVFELSPNGSGGYTESTLYSFTGSSDGSNPQGGVIMDGSGNLYGTTRLGGSGGLGTVFELASNGSGGYTESILHSFASGCCDGATPVAGLIMDSAGNLYGTTWIGGNAGIGTVFELAPDGSGGYTESILHSFAAGEGSAPEGAVIMDTAGNLYGTTSTDGSGGYGTVFKLAPNGSGGYTESTLWPFNINPGIAGANPAADLLMDSEDNLYGTTSSGANGGGAVFELTPSGGTYTESTLYTFDSTTEGNSTAPLIMDSAGNLYGTTAGNGAINGTAFEIVMH